MKLRPDQLPRALGEQLLPVYLIAGDDPLLAQEAADAVRAAARERGFSERELFHADAGFDWEQLLTSANSLSLFAEQRLLEVRIGNGKPGDKGSQALVHYCANPSPDNLLLVITPKLEAAQTRAKWFKTLEQTGAVVTIWPLPPQQFPRWLQQRLKAVGLNADGDAIAVLTERCEGNLLAAKQEIDKLRLLFAEGSQIDGPAMANAVADSARFDLFSLVDRAVSGDAAHAARTLAGLRGEGTEPAVILWALARELRTLAQVRAALDDGQHRNWALKNAGVWERRQPLVMGACERMTLPQIHHGLRLAEACDRAIKGMLAANPWDHLQDLTLHLAGCNPLPPALQRQAGQY